ncbi:T-cell activation Rho GTPase-activating protein-like [Columba livia]|uniref:T-cell activation Rho GTPase-activating protein-like n=1 Tax=Columba livia TaxID=8932 RepID=UPI0031BA2948
MPSFKQLLKELRGRNAAMTLHASSLDRLVESQAKWWEDSTKRVKECLPGTSPQWLFTLFSSAAGGTPGWRRWLPWPFGQRGTPSAAEAAEPSGSGHRGLLFGQPLAALCSQDGTLPQPIQDLLALLQEHGPSTEGIFRLAAGERASRELREALDSGAPVQLESQPVHLLAAILKEFLRKIPSKLLQNELYEDWMSALQKTSRQERLVGLKE